MITIYKNISDIPQDTEYVEISDYEELKEWWSEVFERREADDI